MKLNSNLVRLVAAAAAVAPALSFAAVDAGITGAITAAQTDGLVVIGALAAAGAAVFIIHKLLKRFGVSL